MIYAGALGTLATKLILPKPYLLRKRSKYIKFNFKEDSTKKQKSENKNRKVSWIPPEEISKVAHTLDVNDIQQFRKLRNKSTLVMRSNTLETSPKSN